LRNQFLFAAFSIVATSNFDGEERKDGGIDAFSYSKV